MLYLHALFARRLTLSWAPLRAMLPAALTLCTVLALLASPSAWAQTPPPPAAATPAAPADTTGNPAACPPQASMPDPEQLRAAAERARDHGAMWRLSRDGRESWLYGTLHLGKLDWAMPGPLLRRALASVDAVALEIDVSDPEFLAQMAQQNQAMPALPLPQALAARLARQRQAACLPQPEALAGLHPVLQAITLGGLDARWIGLDPGYGIEFVLAGFARAAGRPVLSLESVGSQLQALVPKQPNEALRVLDLSLRQLETGLTRRVIGRLAQAWADGDLDTVAAYEDWCQCIESDADRALMRRLNDQRNPHLADRIASLHGEGLHLFAAVGLLHMTGAQALPRLLAERGFTVERVPLQ